MNAFILPPESSWPFPLCSLIHIIGDTFSTVSYSPAMYCRPICAVISTSPSVALLTFDLHLCVTH